MTHLDPLTHLDFATLPTGRTKGLLEPDLGHSVEIPYFAVRGSEPGPTLLVTAGVHGAEYASIAAAQRVAQSALEGLRGTLLVLPLVNPPSFFARSIYVNPVDGKNLNRMFPGRAEGSFAERLAHWLSDGFIAQADAFVDLHGGDLVEALLPFTIFQEGHEASLELARAFGIEMLVASPPGNMSVSAGVGRGVPSILAEAGGQGLWPEAEVARLSGGVERVLRFLGMLPGGLEPVPTTLLTEFAWLRSEHAGLWYPEVTAGAGVREGQALGRVETLLGETVQEAVSPVDGVVLFAVSSLAINADDPLVGIGKRED